jgi:NAD(P)-dependent dehydrogenase (short-subunit alcohol dehydrogenase family)
MTTLTGKTAVITGGASGIGRSIAFALAAKGTHVAVLDLNEDRAESTAEDIRRQHDDVDVRARAVDVSDEDAVAAAFADVTAWNGPPDILVNSAGVIAVGSVEETTARDWRHVFAVNVDGVFLTSRAVSEAMRSRGSGKIVNIASWYAKSGKPNYAAYSASKAAVVGFTQSLAMELAPYGVTVNSVCPGLIVETAMRDAADRLSAAKNLSTAKDRAAQIPMGRVGYPADVSKVVTFMCGPDSDYMTGQAINVTGGLIFH